MRKKHTTESIKPTYTEINLLNAIDAVKSGSSIRQASRDWGIPLTTLYGRLTGRVSRREAKEHVQRLSPTQESSLVDWVLVQDQLGLPPTHRQIKHFAQRILKAGGDEKCLGKHWMEQFLNRNPSIKTLKGKRMENSRIKAITAESIKRFFDRLQLPAIQAILPENRYNMDETGIMQGFGINGLVVGSAEKSSTIIRSPQTRIWTSIIECISATGRVLNPAIIFRGKNLDESIFPKDRLELQDWYFGTSKRG